MTIRSRLAAVRSDIIPLADRVLRAQAFLLTYWEDHIADVESESEDDSKVAEEFKEHIDSLYHVYDELR